MRSPYGWTTLAVGALALLAPATASATWPGRPGHVAHDVNEAGHYRIFRFRADGTHSRLLLRNATDPSWSPNGRRVLFVRGKALWVAAASGRRAHRVVRAPGGALVSNPAWAPDGRRVTFTASKEIETTDPSGEPVFTTKYTIYKVNVDGRRLRRLHDGRNAVWSPRGKRIAFVQEGHGVRTMAPGGGRVRTLRNGPEFVSDLDFAPNGRRLAYRATSEGTRLHVLNVRTRGDHALPAERVGQPYDVVWVPGGRRLAYWHQAGPPPDPGAPAPRAELRTIRPNGTGRRIVHRLRSGVFPVNLSWQAKPRR